MGFDEWIRCFGWGIKEDVLEEAKLGIGCIGSYREGFGGEEICIIYCGGSCLVVSLCSVF